MANVVRFALSTAKTLYVPGAGTFVAGILDVDANNLPLLTKTRYLVQPYRAVELGTMDAATPKPTLPAVPGPPAPDPYPQYLTAAEAAASPELRAAFGSGGASAAAPLVQKLRTDTDDVVLAIVGDSTGGAAQTNSWGPRLATWLGQQFPAFTVLRYEWSGSSYAAPVTVQTGTGAHTLRVYNGAAPGQSVQYSITNYETLVPVAPDVVIYSHGHNNGEAVETTPPSFPGFRAIYLSLIRQTVTRYPRAGIILTAQNPKTAPQTASAIAVQSRHAQVIAALAGTEGCGLIDVMGAFLKAPSLAALVDASDGIHPTPAGYDLWLAEAKRAFPVSSPLGGALLPRRSVDRIMVPSAMFQTTSGSITMSYAVEDQYFTRYGGVVEFPDSAASAASAWLQFPDHWENFTATLLWSTPATSGDVLWRAYFSDYKPGTAALPGAKPLGNLRNLADIPQYPTPFVAPAVRGISEAAVVSQYTLPVDSTGMVQLTVVRQADQAGDTAVGIAELHAVVLGRAS